MSNVKIQISNEIQSSNDKKSIKKYFEIESFDIHLTFEL
jgi:hypothetical protein